MKIELTKDKLLIIGNKELLPYYKEDNFNKVIETCVKGFIQANEYKHDNDVLDALASDKEKYKPINNEATVVDDCGIRDRLPNSVDELDNKTVDMTKVNTEQLPMKQYKNFRCPSCGQSAIIKTLGELQSYCFRDIGKQGASLLQINKDHMEDIIDYYFDKGLPTPIPKLFIDSTNPNHELNNIVIVEETDVAITTDGTLKCECICCNKVFNFEEWYDAYKNTNKYFEYEPCYLCGSETLQVIQKNQSMIKCENESCNHTFGEEFKAFV